MLALVLLAFLLGVTLTLLVAGGTYLLLKLQQQRHEKQKIVAGLQDMDIETLKQLLGGEDLPPWLRFPDVVRVQWLNSITQCLWPHIEKAACKWAWENLDELLNSNDFWRPKWLHTSGVKLQGIILGHVPPTVTGMWPRVKVYCQDTHMCREELSTEFDFSWASKMEVKLMMRVSPEERFPVLGHLVSLLSKAVTVKVTVRDLVARGRLRATLRPLIDTIPVVGAVKMSFVEAPTLSYQVKVMGGNPMWFPGLEAWINSFIKNEVLRPYIFPEGFVLRLTDLVGVEQERPVGLLTVKVVEATNVPRMDLFKASDPYCKQVPELPCCKDFEKFPSIRMWLYVRPRRKLQTAVKSSTVHPIWDEEFQLIVHDTTHQTLNLSLWDSDVLTPDDKIGSVEVPLNTLDLTPGATNDLWLPVGGADGKQGGELRPEKKLRFPWESDAERTVLSGKGGLVSEERPHKRGWLTRRRHKRKPQTQPSSNDILLQQGQQPPQQPQPLTHPPEEEQLPQPKQRPMVTVDSSASLAGGVGGSSVGSSGGGGPVAALAGGLVAAASTHGQAAAVPASSHRAADPRVRMGKLKSAASKARRAAGSRVVWDSPRTTMAGTQLRATASGDASQGGGAVSGSAGSGVLERGKEAIGQLGGQGQEALQRAIRVAAMALPSRKECKLHIQVSYSPFPQQELQAMLAGGDAGASLSRLSTSHSHMYQVLRGGVLYIHLNQAQHLIRKRGLMTKNMRCRVSVGRYFKQTERGKKTNSRNPVFDQTMEFILDADTATNPDTVILLEIYDVHWLYMSEFKGRVVVPLQDVIRRQRMRDDWQLEGVDSGRLDMGLEWLGAMAL
ncbi:hypothetical protein N2152v2_007475 [Parachlorella kessleri]